MTQKKNQLELIGQSSNKVKLENIQSELVALRNQIMSTDLTSVIEFYLLFYYFILKLHWKESSNSTLM
jgi:hypothetical protein